MVLLSLSEKRLIRLLQVMNNSRRDQSLLQEPLSEQNRDLREAHMTSLHEMEELKRVQELRVDEFSRRRLIVNQDTINSRDFKDIKSARSGLSHVPSQLALLPLYRDPGGLLSRNDKPTDIWNRHGILGNVFANPVASSSALYPQELNPWSSGREEPIHSSTVEKSERQAQDQDQRCQSGQSRRKEICTWYYVCVVKPSTTTMTT